MSSMVVKLRWASISRIVEISNNRKLDFLGPINEIRKRQQRQRTSIPHSEDFSPQENSCMYLTLLSMQSVYGSGKSDALVGYHAFIGCDSTSQVRGK